MEKVTVHVVAGPNMGKTTIASIIEEALKKWGFQDVRLVDLPPVDNKEPITARMEASLKRPVEIVVELR